MYGVANQAPDGCNWQVKFSFCHIQPMHVCIMYVFICMLYTRKYEMRCDTG